MLAMAGHNPSIGRNDSMENENVNISFDSEELIQEVKRDIKEFGKGHQVMVFIRRYPQFNKSFIVNYDFIVDEMPFTGKDFRENETLERMPLGILLQKLEEQNKGVI